MNMEAVKFGTVVFLLATVVLLATHMLGMWFVAIGSETGITVAVGPITAYFHPETYPGLYFYPDMFPAHNR